MEKVVHMLYRNRSMLEGHSNDDARPLPPRGENRSNDPMELIHAESYEEVPHEVQRLKADTGEATPEYKIVSSPCGEHIIVALDATLYTAMNSDELVDGLSSFPPLKRAASGGSMP